MATIFDREFRREKNLEQAKRQAEMQKPVKKDNTILEKKQAQMTQYLNELQEGFFKHVAEDPKQLEEIKKRGGDAASSVPAKEEPKPQAPAAKEEAKAPA